MPAGRKRTLVIDGFVAVDPSAEVIFVWADQNLEEQEKNVMALILSQLNYFGRRESVCSARVLENGEATSLNCEAFQNGWKELPERLEPVRVLCADPQSALANDFTPKLSSKKRARRSEAAAVSSLYDPDWHLCIESKDLHESGWSDPPGSQWVTYYRNRDALTPGPSSRVPRVPSAAYEAARFTLDGPVLPLTQDAVYLGEIARQFLQGIFGRLFEQEQSEIFSGKDRDGKPLAGHRHAFFLPTDEDGDGRLDHITIYCPEGFGRRELRALDEWRRFRRPGGGVELNVMLTGVIEEDDTELTGRIPILSAARIWRSVTPFVPTRHYKKRGRDRKSVV